MNLGLHSLVSSAEIQKLTKECAELVKKKTMMRGLFYHACMIEALEHEMNEKNHKVVLLTACLVSLEDEDPGQGFFLLQKSSLPAVLKHIINNALQVVLKRESEGSLSWINSLKLARTLYKEASNK